MVEKQSDTTHGLERTPTGIDGLDAITGGGLPKGRATLIWGSSGSGKTLLAMQILLNGAVRFSEPGVYITLEESPEELAQNFLSLGYDMGTLVNEKKVFVDHVHLDPGQNVPAGDFSLEGLFIRLESAIQTVGAKRVVIDPVSPFFSEFSDARLVRSELERLLCWLKERDITTIITAEAGEGSARYGLEEYISDAVIHLGNQISNHISTRYLRIVKYRGSPHSNDEFPFMITESGISVMPVTSVASKYAVSTELVSSGVPRLDAMLGGGYYRGSSVLITGDAGTGKTSLAAAFARASCERDERCLYLAFEEAESQVIRNMRAIGLDLEPYVKSGLLSFQAIRATLYGLETHLVMMQKAVREFKPRAVVVDPISNLINVGTVLEVKSMLTRFIDLLKMQNVTSLFTSLTREDASTPEYGISSLMDSWLLLRRVEVNGEQDRLLYVVKSRGMAHSNQVREFRLTGSGIELVDVYVGPGGVLTGSARAAQENREAAEAAQESESFARAEREYTRRQAAVEAQIASLRAGLESERDELEARLAEAKRRRETEAAERERMAKARRADVGQG